MTVPSENRLAARAAALYKHEGHTETHCRHCITAVNLLDILGLLGEPDRKGKRTTVEPPPEAKKVGKASTPAINGEIKSKPKRTTGQPGDGLLRDRSSLPAGLRNLPGVHS